MGRVATPHLDPYLFLEVNLRMTLAKMTMIRCMKKKLLASLLCSKYNVSMLRRSWGLSKRVAAKRAFRSD